MSFDGYIENNTSNKRYYFRGMTPLRNRQSQTVIALPLVNTTAANTVLFRFTGQEEEFSFEFAIYADAGGTDMAQGTHTSSVDSILEQINYLKDDIYTEQYSDSWTFQHDRYAPSGVEVVITGLEFDNPPGGATIVTARMELRRGSIGAL